MNFDLTLMFLLLKHLANIDCHSDTLPHESDTTLKADLQRLKWYRNKIFHNPSFQIDTKTIEHDSKDIIQVIEIYLRVTVLIHLLYIYTYINCDIHIVICSKL